MLQLFFSCVFIFLSVQIFVFTKCHDIIRLRARWLVVLRGTSKCTFIVLIAWNNRNRRSFNSWIIVNVILFSSKILIIIWITEVWLQRRCEWKHLTFFIVCAYWRNILILLITLILIFLDCLCEFLNVLMIVLNYRLI